jgi:hypothetical protein
MITAGNFQRGEDISFRVLFRGDPSVVVTLPTADLKVLAPGAVAIPPKTDSAAASFTVTPQAGDDLPPGWMITLSAAQTFTLPLGRYIADFRYEPAGGVRFSDPIIFTLVETVTHNGI